MAEEVADSYRSSLDELVINSKPQISMLTMLAEDHVQYASDIIRVIEEQIKKVSVSRKLPIMYLIDSIIKNLSTTDYPQQFAQRIVPIFCGVFQEVDEKTRTSLYKLRQTWVDILPNKQLYILDRKVQLIDPAWPITAKPPEHGVIHVNPKFLKPNKEKERSPQFSPVQPEPVFADDKDELLYAQGKELEALRLKLELAETKAKLDIQKKQLEEQALLRSKKVIDREPPPVIKLPPILSSPLSNTQMANRDPRLARGPPVNRDPRLKKQMEKEEQERLDFDKHVPIAEVPLSGKNLDKISETPLSPRTSSSSLTENSSASQRMDLASLITSFTVAAAKVAAEQSKKSPQPPAVPKQVEVAQHSRLVDSKSKSDFIKERPKSEDSHSTSKNKKPVGKKIINRASESPQKPKSKFTDVKDKRESSIESNMVSPSKSKERIDSNDKNKKEVKDEKKAKRDSKDIERRESLERIDSKDRDRRDSKDRDRRDSKDRDRRDSKDQDRRDSKDRDRRDSKDQDRRDSKDRDRRDSKDKERWDSKDKDRKESKEKRDSKDADRNRDKKELDSNRHSPRRNYGRRSPDFRRSDREERPSRDRIREKSRVAEIVIHTADGKTDQFGRMLRNSGSSSRDRSPLDTSRDKSMSSPKTIENESKIPTKIDHSQESAPESGYESQMTERSDLDTEASSDVKDIKVETAIALSSDDLSEQNMDIEEDSEDLSKNEDLNQDVDMRLQLVAPEIKIDSSFEEKEEKRDSSGDASNLAGPSSGGLKRLNSDSEDIKIEVRPYKIPKLDPSKRAKNDDTQEDISKLFGEEDVDYRHQMLPKTVLVPPPMPSDGLMSPNASNIKSPAQRRWSQFKESHPDDFAQDIERKRLRDAQMQSIAMENQDVDLRHLTSSRQGQLPIQKIDPTLSIPKDLSAENQEQILQKAEQELKEGRISHDDHQEIVRQLGQVYDIQKRRQNIGDRPPRSLDMRDPRLRGIRERGAYPEDIDRRGPFREDIDMHKKPSLPVSGDMPDESAGNSPRYRDRQDNYNAGYDPVSDEDYDARRPPKPSARHERRGGADLNRRRGPPMDYDGRSPRDYDMENSRSPHDFDDHGSARFRDFDGRISRDSEGFNKRGQDYDNRRVSIEEEERHRDFRDHRPYDEYNERPINARGPPIRDLRQDDLRERRRNTPPQEGSYRGLSDEPKPPRPYGVPEDVSGPRPYDMPLGPRNFAPPRHVQDIRVPPPNFQQPRLPGPRPPGPEISRPLGPLPTPPGLLNETSRISDPLDDPRWSAMRGLLANEGAEELVIDGKPFELRMGTSRKLSIYGKLINVAVDLKERGIRIDNQLLYKLGEPIKEVLAAGRSVRLYYHGLPKPIWLDGQQHEMRMDAPPRNVMVDGIRRGFQIDGRDMMILVDRLEKGPYGGPPRKIRIAGIDHDIAFQAPPRRILIDNKSCELKLDSKIPYVVINGKPHGIRFDGEPRTVFINEQPFTIPVDRAEKIRIGPRPTYIAFGGPAHEIIIDGKWFEVKFDNVPKDIHMGNRHFSIRIPGPLPRVKILDELPSNFDESRLLSSHQMLIPQNVRPQMPMQEPNPAVGQMEPFPSNPMNLPPIPVSTSSGAIEAVPVNNQTTEGIMRPVGQDIRFGVPPGQPIMNQPGQPIMNQQGQPIMNQPGQPIMNQQGQPIMNQPGQPIMNQGQPIMNQPGQPIMNHPSQPIMNQQGQPIMNQPGQPIMNQPGQPIMNQQGQPIMNQQGQPILNQQGQPIMNQHGQPIMNQQGQPIMNQQGQPIINQQGQPIMNQQGQPIMNQQGQPIMNQQGQAPILQQQNPVMLPNSYLGLRPNVMGFGMNQPRPQPPNLLAQGLFNQVASSMMNNQINNQFGSVPGLPDFAAGLRALSQITGQVQQPPPPLQPPPQLQPQLQLQPQIQTHLQPPFQPQLQAPLQAQFQAHLQPPPVQPQLQTPLQTQLPTVQKDDAYGAAIVTGIQGTPFAGQQKFGMPVAQSTTNPVGADSLALSNAGNSSVLDVKPSIDINSLLNNLLKVGLIKDTIKTETVEKVEPISPIGTSTSNEVEDLDKKKAMIPELTDFNPEKLRKQYSSVIELLHDGIQCHTCAARFTMSDHEKYRAHLDWHFRQNKMEQEMVKVAKNRKWFYSIPDWVQYEELEDTEEKSRSEIFEQMRPNEEKPVGAVHTLSFQALEGKDVIKNPVATGIEGEDVCATCGDPFDQMWNEETEEWILKNTIKVDGKAYHPVCYEDAQETTPIITPTKNPLDVQLAKMDSTEAEESLVKSELNAAMNSKCVLPEIKQEPMETEVLSPVAPQEIKSEIKEEDSFTTTDASYATAVVKEILSPPRTRSPVVEPELIPLSAPLMLSTITSTVVREVIPLSPDGPLSPWALDSNPTPELSRTPTPEPSPSFTPVPSVSSESLMSLAQHLEEAMSSEDPIPPAQQGRLPTPVESSVSATSSSQQKIEPLVNKIIDDRGL